MKVLLVHNYYRQDSIGGEDVVFRNELEGLKSMLGEENVFVFTKYNDRASLIRVLSGMFFSLSAFFKEEAMFFNTLIEKSELFFKSFMISSFGIKQTFMSFNATAFKLETSSLIKLRSPSKSPFFIK